MRIVITGANGSLGAFLTRYFTRQGHTVIALVRNHCPPQLAALSAVIQADVRYPVSHLPPADLLIHCAALVSDAEPEAALLATNVQGTRHVLDASAHVPVFVHISSSSVYLPDSKPLRESDVPETPSGIPSAYGCSKWLAEQEVLRGAGPNCRYILRPRAVYGPGDRVLLPRICRLKRGPFLLLPGGLNVHTSLTHMENLARVIGQILKEEVNGMERKNHVFNVVDPVPYRLGDVVKTLILGAAKGKVLPLAFPLEPFAYLADLLQFLGIRTRLTRFAIESFQTGVVLDATALHAHFPGLVYTTFEQESATLIKWMRRAGGIQGLMKDTENLAWREI
jgi:nucleoside-diphosphate-sugar epimerase